MNELIIALDSKSNIPLYEQIYLHIKKEIQGRRMKAGERLPSSRALCSHLMVSRSTVDLAYEQLVSEGYIEAVPCKGYYVCDIEELYHIRPALVPLEKKKTDGRPVYDYDFTLSGITPGGFPYNAWKKLSKSVLQEEDPELFLLGDANGERSLREAITSYLYYARGVNCQPDQIIVGAGNDYLLMLLSTILGTGYTVAMENPTYTSAYQAFLRLNYPLASVEMDEMGIRIPELEESGAEIAYVMPSHQFPMGTVMPMKRRMQLLSWAAKEKRYIIEDDYDSEFRYKGKPIPALQGFDQNDRVIYLGTFSRSIAPAIRISYMVLPKELMEQYKKQGKPFSVTVSKVDQKIIERFLNEGYYERHLNRMRALYKSKHDLLLRELHDLDSVCTWSGENAGVHLLLHFKNGMTEEEAIRRAKEESVRVYGLSRYYLKEPAKKPRATVLMGYGVMTENEIVSAMKRLKRAWS